MGSGDWCLEEIFREGAHFDVNCTARPQHCRWGESLVWDEVDGDVTSRTKVRTSGCYIRKHPKCNIILSLLWHILAVQPLACFREYLIPFTHGEFDKQPLLRQVFASVFYPLLIY
jgi:hypothetical protein